MRRFSVLLCTSLAAVVAIVPAAEANPTRAGSVRALSYNVAGLPEPLSGSEPAINSPLISPLLNDYDLVLLQESWQDVLHEQRQAGLVGEEIPPIMYHHLVVGEATHPYRSQPKPHPLGLDLDRLPTGPPLLSDGLNRLSRSPFGELTRVAWERCFGELYTTVIEELLGVTGVEDLLGDAGLGALNDFIDGGSADCGAQKGFSVARTELAPGVTADVYNLHADAGGDPRDVAARAANFAQLADFIVEHSAGHAVILGGDTNLKTARADRATDAQVWRDFLAATGLVDVCDVVDCGEDAGAIDKFAVRDGGQVKLIAQSHTFERETFVRDDGEPLADHEPLAVELRWVFTG